MLDNIRHFRDRLRSEFDSTQRVRLRPTVGKQICSVEACEAVFYAKGWCAKHHMRWWRKGSVDRPNRPRTCSVEGCEAVFYAKGWCAKHYQRLLKYGSVDLPERH
jgi:hypothetical protein